MAIGENEPSICCCYLRKWLSSLVMYNTSLWDLAIDKTGQDKAAPGKQHYAKATLGQAELGQLDKDCGDCVKGTCRGE